MFHGRNHKIFESYVRLSYDWCADALFKSYNKKTKATSVERSWAVLRSSHQESSIKTAVLKYFAIFTWKHLVGVSLPCSFIKERPQHRCFPVNTSAQLLLNLAFCTVNCCYWNSNKRFHLPQCILHYDQIILLSSTFDLTWFLIQPCFEADV